MLCSALLTVGCDKGNGDSGEYFYYTETEEKDVNLTSGTLTVSRSGYNYTFTFEGKAIDYYTDPGTAEEKPFSCSYSGPVTYDESTGSF